MCALEDKLGHFVQSQRSALGRIQVNSQLIVHNRDSLIRLNKVVNKLVAANRIIFHYAYYRGIINDLYVQVVHYESLFNNLLLAIELLTRDIVSPFLLPFSELGAVLERGSHEFSLRPLTSHFLYYTLLTTSMVNHTLKIHVPFKEEETYKLVTFIPFPSFHKGSHLIVDGLQSNLVVSTDNSQSAILAEDARRRCKPLPSSIVCRSTDIVLQPFNRFPCEFNMLLHNSSRDCTLVEVHVRYVYSQHLDDADYLYYPNRTAVAVHCPPDPVDQVTVQGRLRVPLSCHVVSGDARRIGWDTHNVGLYSRKVIPAVPVQLVNETLLQVATVRPLSPISYNDSFQTVFGVFSHSSHGVLSGSLTIIVSLLLLGFLAYLAFKCKGRWRKSSSNSHGRSIPPPGPEIALKTIREHTSSSCRPPHHPHRNASLQVSMESVGAHSEGGE